MRVCFVEGFFVLIFWVLNVEYLYCLNSIVSVVGFYCGMVFVDVCVVCLVFLIWFVDMICEGRVFEGLCRWVSCYRLYVVKSGLDWLIVDVLGVLYFFGGEVEFLVDFEV